MKTAKRQFRILTSLAALCLTVLALSAQEAKQGVLDLRQGFSLQKQIALKGEWRFYWNKLITPHSESNEKPDYFPFPKLWNDASTKNGIALNPEGYATYRLQLLLPVNSPTRSIKIPDVYCAYRLFVNGVILAESGKVDTTAAGYHPQWVPHTIMLPKADTIDLLFQVANFSHAKGGVVKQMILGPSEVLHVTSEQHIAADFLLAGSLFMGGLFFFGLFLFGRQDRATLYFSLFCMLYSYRIIGSGEYALHAVVQDWNWNLAIRLEYISLFGSVFFFLQYIRYLYPHDFYKPAMNFFSAGTLLVSLSPILTSPTTFTQLINPFLIAVYFCIVFILITFVVAIIRKRPTSSYTLMSIVLLAAVAVAINLEYFGFILPSKLIIFTGYAGFFFLQSLILSYRFAYILEKARRDAEQGHRAKTEFLSAMSHEIRTPLNSVIGMTHLLLKSKPREDQKEQLNVLLFSANNLLTIVNDILDYNKIEAGKINFEHIEFDPRAICQNIVIGFQSQASDKGIKLEASIDPSLRHVLLGDPTRLSQVITNLVHNGIKFTKQGSVTLDVMVTKNEHDHLQLLFKVIDTGIGIPLEKQVLIFDQFSQADSSTSRSYGGTGLGLAISKRILELQGSELNVQSSPGQGSTFYFEVFMPIVRELPLFNLQTENDKNDYDEIPDILHGVDVLLVDDNPMNVLVAQSFLERWGAHVDIAENGQEAVDKIDPKRHRIVLMDMHMPVMDGYEASRIIRQRGIHIPIVALTASLPKEKNMARDYPGIDDIVVKPFVPQDLQRTILHYLQIGSRF